MASSEQLEREADDARTRVLHTLDELRARTTPGQLVDHLIDYANASTGGAFLNNLGRQVAENPLPIALLGTSLAWLALARNGSAARGDGGALLAGATDASRSFLALCKEDPIVLAGIGVALGALLGAFIPSGTVADAATSSATRANAGAQEVVDAELGHA